MLKSLNMETLLNSYILKGNPLGPTCLFLHGFLGSKKDWVNTVDDLQSDYQILLIDLPGHGEALFEDPLCYCIDIYAAKIATLVEELGLSTIYLVGYSMGGRVALYLLVHYPHLFQKILLISTSPGIKSAREREKRLKEDLALARALEVENFHLFLKNWYAQEIFSSLNHQKKLREELIFKRSFNSPKHLSMALQSLSIGRQQPLWQKLSETKVPLDIVVGELDPKFVAIGEQIQACCLDIKLHKIQEAGHIVHLENPNDFDLCLEHWLEY